ncbi:MAG: hypothetical protein J6P61_09880 [Erysipelotrichaceae bacterium]|nr:hypothetical protein [Erysipelotrichaceae bacterium]
MEITKVSVYSNRKKIHHMDYLDEVEQTLTVLINGDVYLDTVIYGEGYGQYQDGRHEHVYVGDQGFEIIKYVSLYFAKHGSWGIVPGLGSWRLTMTDSEGKDYMYYGSLTGAHNELTNYIRERVNLDGLCVFSNHAE